MKKGASMENEALCRIKRDSSAYYAKRIRTKDKVDFFELDLKSFDVGSKEYKETFYEESSSPTHSNGGRFDKWKAFGYDVWAVPEDLLPYYLIDKKLSLYESITELKKQFGFKYENIYKLKQGIFLRLRNKGFSDDVLRQAVDYYFEKGKKSYLERKKRFLNKAYANLEIWNYFVTFTKDDSLISEDEDFIKKIKNYLNKRASYDGWKYMFVFERSSKGRIHVHGIFYIPEDSYNKLDVQEERYYNKKRNDMASANISQVLKKSFGRVDFVPIIKGNDEFNYTLEYICKYISKQENKIVYSRGLKDEYLGIIPNFDEKVVGYISHFSSFVLLDEDPEILWINKVDYASV